MLLPVRHMKPENINLEQFYYSNLILWVFSLSFQGYLITFGREHVLVSKKHSTII